MSQYSFSTPNLAFLPSVWYKFVFNGILHLMQAQNPVREDISKLKEDFSTFKQEMMVCSWLLWNVRTYFNPTYTLSNLQ